MSRDAGAPVRLGLRHNLAQFALLVGVNALVGGMLGQERTVLPLLARQEFHLDAYAAGLTFILAFGVAKAATNYLAGSWSDRVGRKPVLVTGWVVAVPVPLLLIWAPAWGWVILANVLLGISQGLTWSTTVVMKIDLVGPERRGLAMGLNEAAGYVAVAATALATGALASSFGLRPQPFRTRVCHGSSRPNAFHSLRPDASRPTGLFCMAKKRQRCELSAAHPAGNLARPGRAVVVFRILTTVETDCRR